MLFGDLKRAIEDTILKPETNRLSEIGKRTTIAALDLVQVSQFPSVYCELLSFLLFLHILSC